MPVKNLKCGAKRGQIMKFFGVFALICGIFCIAGSTAAHAASDLAWDDHFGFTKDMTPVDIDLNVETPEAWAEFYPGHPYPTPVKLRIPKAFMYFSGNWKGGYQRSVTLEVKPDLTPAALDEDPIKNFNKDLHIKLMHEGKFLYDKEILNFRNTYTKLSSDNPSYDEYRTPGSVIKNPDMQSLIYVPKNASPDDAVYIKCNTYPTTPNCFMYDEFDSKILIQSIIPKNIPEEWMNIRASVRKLVSQFRMDN